MATIVEQLLLHKGREVHCVAPNATIGQSVALMGERQIGAVVVCHGQQVVGLLSERDCVRRLLWKKECSSDSPVHAIMRVAFPTVQPSDSIQQCMSLMNDRRTRHLPVVERGLLVGLVSIGDVINGLLHEQQHLIEALETYISGSPSARPSAHY